MGRVLVDCVYGILLIRIITDISVSNDIGISKAQTFQCLEG